MYIKKVKKTLIATILGVALLPTAAFAQTDYEKQLDLQYGPENGSALLIETPAPHSQAFRSFDITPMSANLWTASYVVNTHFQIPYDIPVASNEPNVQVVSTSSANTGSNTTYDLVLEEYDYWSGGWWGASSMTKTVSVGGTAYQHWTDLKEKDYRVRVKGNVKGSLTARTY